MSLELLAPLFPRFFLLLACLGSVSKAVHTQILLRPEVTGVAGGCTKAAISRHQAKKQNMADVAAKDGSQEVNSDSFKFTDCGFVCWIVVGNIYQPTIGWTSVEHLVHISAADIRSSFLQLQGCIFCGV